MPRCSTLEPAVHAQPRAPRPQRRPLRAPAARPRARARPGGARRLSDVRRRCRLVSPCRTLPTCKRSRARCPSSGSASRGGTRRRSSTLAQSDPFFTSFSGCAACPRAKCRWLLQLASRALTRTPRVQIMTIGYIMDYARHLKRARLPHPALAHPSSVFTHHPMGVRRFLHLCLAARARCAPHFLRRPIPALVQTRRTMPSSSTPSTSTRRRATTKGAPSTGRASVESTQTMRRLPP